MMTGLKAPDAPSVSHPRMGAAVLNSGLQLRWAVLTVIC